MKKKRKKKKGKLQANSRLGRMNESGPGVGSAKVWGVWGGKWRRLSSMMVASWGRERDHCKLARPSAKPIIRTQDERRGGGRQPRLSGGGAGSWFGRSAANLLRTFNKHTPGRLQGGRFDLLGVWYLFCIFFKEENKNSANWQRGETRSSRKCRNTNVNVICS